MSLLRGITYALVYIHIQICQLNFESPMKIESTIFLNEKCQGVNSTEVYKYMFLLLV